MGYRFRFFDRIGFLLAPPGQDIQNNCLQKKVLRFSRLFQTMSDSVRSISHLLCNEPLCIIGVQPLRSTVCNNLATLFLYSRFRASSLYINKIQQDATDAGIYY